MLNNYFIIKTKSKIKPKPLFERFVIVEMRFIFSYQGLFCFSNGTCDTLRNVRLSLILLFTFGLLK